MAYIGNKPPVVSNLITDLKIGEDDETKIDFADANTINFHANNSKEMVLVENALTPGTSDGIALGTTSLMWSDLFLASGAVLNFNNGNVTMTHSADTLTVVGATVAFTASTAVTVSNDLKLASDSAVLGFGADNDTTLTHTDGTGLTLNSTNKLTFGDAASFIQQSADGTLTIDGEAIIDLNASTRVDVSGDLKVGSNIELGNASDTTLARSAAGEVTIEGDAIKKVGLENMWVPAQAMTPRDNAGCGSLTTTAAATNGRADITHLPFDASTQEHAQFSVAMPKSWNEGTIKAQFYWTTTGSDTDAVIWGISGVSYANDNPMDVAFGTAVTVTDNILSAAKDILVTAETADVTIAGSPAAGEICYFEVFRDADDGSDTVGEDCLLIGVKIIYTTDTSTDA